MTQFEVLEKEVSRFLKDLKLNESEFVKVGETLAEIDRNIGNYSEKLQPSNLFTPYLHYHVSQLKDSVEEVRMRGMHFGEISEAIRSLSFPVGWSCDKFSFRISFPVSINFEVLKAKLKELQVVNKESFEMSDFLSEEYNLLLGIDDSEIKGPGQVRKEPKSQKSVLPPSRQNSVTLLNKNASQTGADQLRARIGKRNARIRLHEILPPDTLGHEHLICSPADDAPQTHQESHNIKYRHG